MKPSSRQFWPLAILSLALTCTATPKDARDDASILVGGNVNLRLMPLGASITRGKGSEDGNGYRNYLRELLVADGNDVDMVGTQKSGTMEDNDHEGWDGLRIDQVYAKAQASVPDRLPNLFTVNAGTNDCAQDYEVDSAADRMQEMLEYLWDASPKASIILSTLLVNGDDDIEARVLQINKQLETLGEQMTNQSRKLILVDMHSSDGPQKDELVDGTHPNSTGYNKMAKIWYKGIEDAASRGWLESPQALPTTTSSTTPSASPTSNATSTVASASATATSEAVSKRAVQDESQASRLTGFPTIVLILALSTMFLLG